MILNAILLNAEVVPSTFFDQVTGAQKTSYALNMTVFDADTDEKYECQVAEGLPRLDELKEARRRGEPPQVQEHLADALQAELPPKMTPLTLEVVKLKGKSAAFIRLVCRLVQVAATV